MSKNVNSKIIYLFEEIDKFDIRDFNVKYGFSLNLNFWVGFILFIF